MDVIEAYARRLPPIDARWTPRPCSREELVRGLFVGKVAGIAAHPIDNVRGNIAKLIEGDPDKQFAMTGLPGAFGFDDVLALVEEASGEPIDRAARFGPVHIATEPILEMCERIGDRLRQAAERGESVVVASGHPVGLAILYSELAALLTDRGAKILTPADGVSWVDAETGHYRQIRYYRGVGHLCDRTAPKHTHDGAAMERILADARPDLVLADHGFAGAAIERGIETVSVADVNDPALIVARAQGRTDHVLVMDDNVDPTAYWPCFQATAARFDPLSPATS
jgi:Phosphatase